MDSIKVLMVDDESRMRKLVKDFLTREGYMVLEAGDGEQMHPPCGDNAAEARFLSRRRGRGRVLLMCGGDGLVGHDGSWCYGLFPLHSMPNLCEHVVGL